MMKKIAVLGSTGSIGTQTLEVVRYNKDIQVTALAAGSNVKLLEEQIREFKPRLACLWDEEKAKELRAAVADLDVKVAVMGCVVNGPGEAREADIGIAGGVGEGLLIRRGEIIRKVPESELLAVLREELLAMSRERRA